MIANISIGESAVKQIEILIKANKDKNILLRVSVTGGGCSGFQYHFNFDTKRQDDDLEIQHNNKILALIDETSYELLKDSEIVFVDNLNGSYFKMENPNAKNNCGCGTSFNI